VQLELMSQLLAGSAIDSARQQLDRTRGLVREGLAEARRSIWDLRSDSKENETLPARLRRTIHNAVENSAASAYAEKRAQAHVEITGTYMQLADSIENELLRIAQEAVTNTLRHARAMNVTVRLIYDPGQVLLEIADDGRGFDPATVRSSGQGHFGLTGMRERAQQIHRVNGVNGEFTIDSTPGWGTRILMVVPASAAAGQQARQQGKESNG